MTTTRRVLLVSVSLAWLTGSVVLAMAGWFAVDDSTPPWPVILAVVIPVTVFAALLSRQPLRRLVLSVDPRLMLTLQLWRVLGVAFLFGWASGDLDGGFAIPAGVGDVATGIAAFVVLAMLTAGRLRRSHIVAFTVLGIGDFILAVVSGAVLRPDGLLEVPWVLFPAIAVPVFAIIHIVNWIQLSEIVDRGPLFPRSRPGTADEESTRIESHETGAVHVSPA